MTRNVAFFFEEARICLNGRLVQINYVSCFFEDGSGLIEADMTVKTDAEELEIDAAKGLDASIIFSTFFCKVLTVISASMSPLPSSKKQLT